MDCSCEGCDRPSYCRSLCRPHYRRLLRAGTTDGLSRKRGGECEVSGCENEAAIRGLCDLHYGRLRKTGSTETTWPRQFRCQMCGGDFLQAAPNSLHCGDCKAARKRESDAAWYRKNRSEAKAASRKRYWESPEVHREWHRNYRRTIKDRRREYEREWRRANPDRRKAAEQRRQAVKRGASAIPFSRDELEARLSMFGHKCWMCGAEAEHVDHVKPVSKGGIHALCNLRPACAQCNLSKSARWPFVRPTSGLVGIVCKFYGLERV